MDVFPLNLLTVSAFISPECHTKDGANERAVHLMPLAKYVHILGMSVISRRRQCNLLNPFFLYTYMNYGNYYYGCECGSIIHNKWWNVSQWTDIQIF